MHIVSEKPQETQKTFSLISNSPPPEIEVEIESSYGNFSFIESQEIFSFDKKQESLNENIQSSNKIKAGNHLLLQGFISEDWEIMRKANDEFEAVIKENTDKLQEESQILSDPYIGLLILNLFKTKNSSLQLTDLLESYALVIEVHGIPQWEKQILLLHSCEKIIREQNQNDGIIEEKIKKYQEVLNGFKKIMSNIFLKLKNVETINDKFLLDLFKEYLKPSEGDEAHSDLIISLAICYIYVEIKIVILDKNGVENKNKLKNFLNSFWNFLRILKNNKKYEIIKTFFDCIIAHETLIFMKAIIFYYLICFKHYYHNSQEEEIKEIEAIFTFNPMNYISFEENSEFKTINNLLKAEKNKLHFEDYKKDKYILLHYFKLLSKKSKEIERLYALKDEDEPGKNEMNVFAREKKTYIEKLKFFFLCFDYKKSLRLFEFLNIVRMVLIMV